jgi:hypothetical protein
MASLASICQTPLPCKATILQAHLGLSVHILIRPCSYSYDVQEDGTFDNRKTFAYVSPGVPDGKLDLAHWPPAGLQPQADCPL